MELTACNRRDNGDFRLVGDSRRKAIQEANVFAIHIDVDKPLHLLVPIADPLAKAGKSSVQLINDFAHGSGADFDGFLITG